MVEKSPTFQFWNLILTIQILVLIFIRAHRQRNFPLYVESLEALMFLFFAVDHYSYSRWATIHLRDTKSLPESAREDFIRNWLLQKKSNRFSIIPLDQAHKEENAKVKGKGGAVGLTENPTALKRWMIAEPEFARLITEFEYLYLPERDPELHYRYHGKGISTQKSFHKSHTSG